MQAGLDACGRAAVSSVDVGLAAPDRQRESFFADGLRQSGVMGLLTKGEASTTGLTFLVTARHRLADIERVGRIRPQPVCELTRMARSS